MYIKRYSEFTNNKRNHYIDSKILMLDKVQLSESGEALFLGVFKNLLKSVDESYKIEINEFLRESNLLLEEEGFFDKLKDRFPKAAKVSNVLSDKGEKILNTLLQKAKDAVSFVGKVKNLIKDFFVKTIQKTKEIVTEHIKGGKIKDKIEKLNDKQRDGLKTDLKNGKGVLKWYKEQFMEKVGGSIDDNMTEFMSGEVEPMAESMNEGHNVIATMVHGIEKIPPFSWLYKVAQAGEAGVNQLISVMSKATQKMGGPSFELPIVAVLIGIVFEQLVKSNVSSVIFDLVGSATPFGIAIKGLKYIALIVAVIAALDAVLGDKILGGHEDHGDKKSKPTNEEPVEEEDKNEEV